MNSKHFVLCFVFLIAMISCQPATKFESEAVPSPSSTPTGQSNETPSSLDANLDNLTRLAIADLAQRLELEPKLVTVIEAQPATWPDNSLGCPQAGLEYAQVLTPGFLIRLEAHGQVYEYHTDMENIVNLCNYTFDKNNPPKDTDKSVDDGWPNQTKDKDVIIVTPTQRQ